jgi:hypothetical protein
MEGASPLATPLAPPLITREISHVKRFHMKLQVKFHMRNDHIKVKSEISHVKDFT